MSAANRPHILEEYLKTKDGIAAQSSVSTAAATAQAAAAPVEANQQKKSNFMSWGKK